MPNRAFVLPKPLYTASAAPMELAERKTLAIIPIAAEAQRALKKHYAQPFQPQDYPNTYRDRSKAFRRALRPQQGLHHNCSDPSAAATRRGTQADVDPGARKSCSASNI